jgi:hypothetical protein
MHENSDYRLVYHYPFAQRPVERAAVLRTYDKSSLVVAYKRALGLAMKDTVVDMPIETMIREILDAEFR